MEMGHRAYARHRGVTLGAVQKALRDKRIFLNANGKLDPEAADRDWEANTDKSRVAVNVLGQAEPPAAEPDPLPAASGEVAPLSAVLVGSQQQMDLQPSDAAAPAADG